MSKKQSNTTLTPTLRFPEFSGEWEEKKLGEMDIYVSDGNYGEMYPKANEMKREGVPFIRANNIKGLKVVWDDMYFISPDLHKDLQSGHLKDGDILVTTRGEIGMLAYVVGEFEGSNINAQICLLRVGEDISSKYLLNYLSSQLGKRQFKQLQTGSALKQLPKGNLAKIIVMVPAFSEQQKIASFLTSIDDWIENLKKQKEAQEKYKKGMMQKIFSQELRFKKDDGSDYPRWEEKRLAELGNIYNGLTGKSGEDFGEGEPFITYKQIFDNSEINITKFSLVNVSRHEKQNRAQFGDVFFTTSSETPNEVGFSSVLLKRDHSPFLNSFSFGFRPNSNLSPHFAKFLFRSPLYRKKIVRLAQGSTRYNISKISFVKEFLEIPSFEEQRKIADFLSSVDDLINLANQRITQAEKWKKGVMQRVFV